MFINPSWFINSYKKISFALIDKSFSFSPKKPFQILVEAEPRLWRGEVTIAQNPNSENWRCFLIDVRTFFDENPNPEF
ncbi:MAG: hypothetical protein A3C82_00765 [Candidatus Wildermuthbacteria bacterium RIFCSPHIGHO2_02_FULL_47_12]|uniref:Uncharacterized protein n=1 Tax=Candidatus Wildermuthbacteria bacterium RIFCSPHIGHO2_02_FULL_47_12 TaxID=1802451 RepID=A0A1G2R1M6_9BACT|nr:MAG: hypothetical protein A3C82_00765 [Candidatus Wildermuthbacteria bacterium RIFCSPHIGHO2_02_FULL_47_12]